MKNYIQHNGQTIKVETYYKLGGYNSKRGYYLSVQPVERVEHKLNDGSTYFMEKYTAFTGYLMLMLEVQRQTKKHEAEAEKKASDILPFILERFN